MAFVEPSNYFEAAEHEEWKQAMLEEMKMIGKNDTWLLVDRPRHKKVIGVKLVFRVKLNPDSSVNKHKARLVVKGYSQDPEIDYTDTFAPVARLDTVRLLPALAAQNRWEVFQLDVKSAFLNGILNEEIYVEQPEGFLKKGEENKVFLLKKALCGFKQALRAWYSRLEQHLSGLGFVKSINDATLFVKNDEAELLVVSVYVDDLLVTGSKKDMVDEFKADIRNMVTARSLIGSLLHLTATRPDLVFAVNFLSRFMQCPSEIHFKAAKRVLRYVRGTKLNSELDMSSRTVSMIGFTDSDWAGTDPEMKSTSGYCFSIGSMVYLSPLPNLSMLLPMKL